MRTISAYVAAMIRIDEVWLATEPLDMRAGPDTALARVVQVFGSARPHCAYLFANKRGNRMKVLIHDGLGIWLCARRLNKGKFHWGETWRGKQVQLEDEQLAALVQGLPWQRLGAALIRRKIITILSALFKNSCRFSEVLPEKRTVLVNFSFNKFT